MSSVISGASVDGNVVQRLHQDFTRVTGFPADEEDVRQDVAVRMASKQHPLWSFVDDGDEVELYVIFAEGCNGVPWEEGTASSSTAATQQNFDFTVELAGEIVPLKPLLCTLLRHSQMYKATVAVSSTTRPLLTVGNPIPFRLQYYDVFKDVCDITSVSQPNKPVYYQPVWSELQERDKSIQRQISVLEGTKKLPKSSNEVDEIYSESDDNLVKRNSIRPTTPVQLAEDDYFLYYTRKACSPFLRSQNPLLRFFKELMVTPLTNVTGLSLYYQLYLVEIFHVKFFTKAGHYVFMHLVVLLMATWFAQWRFIGDYKIQDFSILIFNGTAVFVIVLQVWYIAWGFLYRMYLFGIFMIYPLLFIYILANMMFQMIVINSMWIRDSDITVEDVKRSWGKNSTHWYDFITLSHFGVVWYFHPLIWALVFSAFQALSHIFEDKLPPRVSQTAHWMDLTTVLKNNGFVSTSLICVSQIFFGTINEFLASPRLLPLLVLRICYTIGYMEVPWLKFRLLVDECLKYGDPAIDYIGRGGAVPADHFEDFQPETIVEKLRDIEAGLSKAQKEGLKDPDFLKDPKRFTPFLQHYVTLRHRLTKYRIQVNAYGPFTPKGGGDEMPDQKRMKNDFPENSAFRMFLEEARCHFSEMEWVFLNESKLYSM